MHASHFSAQYCPSQEQSQDKPHVFKPVLPFSCPQTVIQSTFSEDYTEGREIIISLSTIPVFKLDLLKMLVFYIIIVLWGLLWFFKHSCNLNHFTVFLLLTLPKVTQCFSLSGFRMKISRASSIYSKHQV